MKNLVLICVLLFGAIIVQGKEKVDVNVKIIINDERISGLERTDNLINEIFITNKKAILTSFNVLVNSKSFTQRIITGKKGKVASIVEKEFSCEELLGSLNEPLIKGEIYILYVPEGTEILEDIPREIMVKPFQYVPGSYEEIVEKISKECKMASKFEKKNTHIIFYFGDLKGAPTLILEGGDNRVSVGDSLKFNYAGVTGNADEWLVVSESADKYRVNPVSNDEIYVVFTSEDVSGNIYININSINGCESEKVEIIIKTNNIEPVKPKEIVKNNKKNILKPCEKIRPEICFEERFNYLDYDKNYYHWFDKADEDAIFDYLLYPKEVGSANFRFYVKSCASKFDLIYYGWDRETKKYVEIFKEIDKVGYPVAENNDYYKLAIDDDRILTYRKHKLKIIGYDSNGGKHEVVHKVAFMDCDAHD